MIHAIASIAAYWPWLLLAVVLFALPLVYIALEVAAAELLAPGTTLGEVDEAYVDAVALTIPCCPQHGGLHREDGGAR